VSKVFAAICAALLFVTGCSTSSSDPPKELASCRSWIATARVTAEQWRAGEVTDLFARQTLEAFEEELPKTMASLPSSTFPPPALELETQARRARHAAIALRGLINASHVERASPLIDSLASSDSLLAAAIENFYPTR
jgi:hypothetical protein